MRTVLAQATGWILALPPGRITGSEVVVVETWATLEQFLDALEDFPIQDLVANLGLILRET